MMIPKPDALILGMLMNEKERMSPYDMAKLAKTINPNYWISVARPTFYVNVQRLAKRGLLVGETTKLGKMPNKTLYSLTDLGRETIKDAFLGFLESDEIDPEMFRLVIFFLSVIPVPREELYPYLFQRIELLKSLKESLSQEGAPDNSDLPLNLFIINKYTKLMIEAEIEIAEELHVVMTDDDKWSFYSKMKLADMAKY
jgi:DNA-binding PadR family transcriptional regulator